MAELSDTFFWWYSASLEGAKGQNLIILAIRLKFNNLSG
jgi:hypothetical protein